MSYSAVKHVASQMWMVGKIAEHVAKPLDPDEVNAACDLLNAREDRTNWRQYFRVDIKKSIAVPYLYNLTIWRLMKAKEAKESGHGNFDKWVLVSNEVKGIDARNAQCIIQMLETPRPPLQNHEEEKLWQERLAKLDNPSINLPSTVAPTHPA